MTSIGLCAQLTCIWEATARKPGNVHRFADFADTTYLDFLLSAAAIAPVMETAPARRVGETVLEAVRATRQVVAANTNLGIILLLAPLATVPAGEPLATGIGLVLATLDEADARLVYEAIRLARPGGLGYAPEQDVHSDPTQTLREVMTLAAARDRVARQYACEFNDVLDAGLPALLRGVGETQSLEGGIICCHLHLLAAEADSLILRKCGPAIAAEASQRAQQVLAQGWPRGGDDTRAELDAWLRADGNRRNPGTCADLVTACLFAALREEMIPVPLSVPFARA